MPSMTDSNRSTLTDVTVTGGLLRHHTKIAALDVGLRPAEVVGVLGEAVADVEAAEADQHPERLRRRLTARPAHGFSSAVRARRWPRDGHGQLTAGAASLYR